ncbi:MAG: hypothetical protein HOQ05_10610 [Corynebacteriales bacterium]|nr:hypothetical protein [Mycobacteriales bacterium]
MPTDAEIDTALEAVITAARHHRAMLSSDAVNPEQIWHAKVALNNASVHYDDLIRQEYDAQTPWDCEYIPDDDFDAELNAAVAAHPKGTPIVCVRHRRDYLVPEPRALLEVATLVRAEREGIVEPIRHLGQAIYALIEAGDNTLAALDEVDELVPANGVLLVNQLGDSAAVDANSPAEPSMRLLETDRLLYRLDESMEADEELVG